MSTLADEHAPAVAPDDTSQLPSEQKEPEAKGGESVTEIKEAPRGHLAPRIAPWEPPPDPPEPDPGSMRGPGAVQHGGEKRGRRNPSFPDINITATAANLGITKSHLAKVLSGENKPSIDLAIALARVLGVPIEQVVGLYKYSYMHARRGK